MLPKHIDDFHDVHLLFKFPLTLLNNVEKACLVSGCTKYGNNIVECFLEVNFNFLYAVQFNFCFLHIGSQYVRVCIQLVSFNNLVLSWHIIGVKEPLDGIKYEAVLGNRNNNES